MSLRSAPTLAVLLALALPLSARADFAQPEPYRSWLGGHVLFPAGDAADAYDTGFGVTAAARNYVSPSLAGVLETAWFYVPGKTVEGVDIDDTSTLAVLVGGVYLAGLVEVGIKGGYYFLDLHQWDAVPFTQIRVGHFAVGAEHKAFGSTNWTTAFVKMAW